MRGALVVIGCMVALGSGLVALSRPWRASSGPVRPRIVSLNPCSDAILAEVADPDQILAISSYSKNPDEASLSPAAAARFPSTRGTVEEVVALQPDLVIDGAYAAPSSVTAFGRLGIRFETMGTQRSVADTEADVRRVAALAGHPERGEVLVRRMETALAAAAPPADFTPLDAVMWEGGGIVAGDDTLIGDLMSRTGFTNVAGREGFQQADLYPLERLLAAPPRVLMTSGSGRALHHPALAALHETTRADMPQNLLYCGGPTVIRTAGWLAALREAVRRGEKNVSGRKPADERGLAERGLS
ncbi:ABC transporter substrate-binding protein [Novosphingobium nitrogenifigens]|uniref:ABC transporter substrate-binding protein n=1 Tax=Novosphingobium nitrogenifigens TaxID=378548 RepID=UPI001E2FB80B|nr:ABC transporter substrate-binding protein [Novosphingobium nitrogenifigens]